MRERDQVHIITSPEMLHAHTEFAAVFLTNGPSMSHFRCMTSAQTRMPDLSNDQITA